MEKLPIGFRPGENCIYYINNTTSIRSNRDNNEITDTTNTVSNKD